jgi:very-short-patch-repair endonuclease
MKVVSELAASTMGVFRVSDAAARGVSRQQLLTLRKAGVIERMLPAIYRMTAVPPSSEQRLHAAMLWARGAVAVGGRSAGGQYRLEGVAAARPEIVAERETRAHAHDIVVYRASNRAALMVRQVRGLPTTGVEATLRLLAGILDAESLEIACEDARRRELTSGAALHAYLDRFGGRGQTGTGALRALLRELDPVHASRSTLEVKTRRLLMAHGYTGFKREFPLTWNGRRYLFDFCFPAERTILETNGRRWHNDPRDFEYDNEKWSVPARHGYKIVLATWEKVTGDPGGFIADRRAGLHA